MSVQERYEDKLKRWTVSQNAHCIISLISWLFAILLKLIRMVEFLDFVYSQLFKNTFPKIDMFSSSGLRQETPTLLGP
jgi:hypothetical protein